MLLGIVSTVAFASSSTMFAMPALPLLNFSTQLTIFFMAYTNLSTPSFDCPTYANPSLVGNNSALFFPAVPFNGVSNIGVGTLTNPKTPAQACVTPVIPPGFNISVSPASGAGNYTGTLTLSFTPSVGPNTFNEITIPIQVVDAQVQGTGPVPVTKPSNNLDPANHLQGECQYLILPSGQSAGIFIQCLDVPHPFTS